MLLNVWFVGSFAFYSKGTKKEQQYYMDTQKTIKPMRKLLLSFALLSAISAHAQGEFSAQAAAYKSQYQKAGARTRAAGQEMSQAGPFVVTCKVAASPFAVGEKLKALGADVKSVFGRNLIVTIPVDQLDAMAQTEGVLLIDVGQKAYNETDITRRATQVEEVLAGTGAHLPQAYTGKGVIIGLIDQGFDCTHPAFKDKDNNLRIKAVYMGGNPKLPSEKVTVEALDKQTGTTVPIELGPGIVSDPKVILDTTQVKSEIDTSHGTLCAAVAAGRMIEGLNGLSGKPLGGMAPEAELIFCENQMDLNILSELAEFPGGNILYFNHYLAYMVDYAKKQNKPLVVSWSENIHFGWHNGTSPGAQLVGKFCKDGNVMILGTGNEGSDNMYIHRTIKAGDSLNVAVNPKNGRMLGYYYFKTMKPLKVRVGILDVSTSKEVYSIPYTLNTGSQAVDTIPLLIDPKGTDPAIKARLNAIDKKWLPVQDKLSNYITSASGDISTSQGTALESAESDKTFEYTYLQLEGGIRMVVDNLDPKKRPLYMLTLHVSPEEDTEVISWIHDMQYAKTGIYEAGTNDVSVGDLNTSGECVSVGAWNANNVKKEFLKATETDSEFPLNDISYFSSWGTDLAGHKHPQACAPGALVYSALNSFVKDKKQQYPVYDSKNFTGQFEGQAKERLYEWGYASGTSLSTPAAAGIVALWMQAAMDKDPNKRLTCKDIKDIINHSCDTDEYTKAKPERFGAGKINAYKGLLYVLGIDTAIKGLSKNQPDGITFRLEGDLLWADGAADGTTASLYNLQGVLVSEATVQGGAISLSGLQKGVYALQLGKLGSTLIRR